MSQITSKTKRRLAQKAVEKTAEFGTDIDFENYSAKPENHSYVNDLSRFPSHEKENMINAGVILENLSQRSGTFIQKDQSPVHFSARQEGVEVMSLSQSLQKYEWINEYLWNAVKINTDKYTAFLGLNESDGYFIRSLPGVKALFPVQACLYLGHKNIIQKVHNIVIAEEASELHVITGCTTNRMSAGLHLGVSEFYIKRNAKVTFTMIHNWAPDVEMRARSTVILEENGVFLNNYLSMKPVRSIQMYPTVRCVGNNAITRLNSIIVGPLGSNIDVGSRVILDSEGSRAEIISRAITTGGVIIARGDIQANKPHVKGHLECRGLILREPGMIHAIPELAGRVSEVDLSHEAAVGKIADEQIEYLMSRGLTRHEATSIIVRGFLKVDIEGLPVELENELNRAIQESENEIF